MIKVLCLVLSMFFFSGCVTPNLSLYPVGNKNRLTECSRNKYVRNYMPIWESLPIVFHVDRSISENSVLAIKRAAASWNIVLGWDAIIVKGSVSHLNAVKNEFNLIHWNENSNPDAQEIAYAELKFQKLNFLSANIFINGGNFDFTYGGIVQPDTFDLESVFVHEFGHVLGLGHTPDGVMVEESDTGMDERTIESSAASSVKCLYISDDFN